MRNWRGFSYPRAPFGTSSSCLWVFFPRSRYALANFRPSQSLVFLSPPPEEKSPCQIEVPKRRTETKTTSLSSRTTRILLLFPDSESSLHLLPLAFCPSRYSLAANPSTLTESHPSPHHPQEIPAVFSPFPLPFNSLLFPPTGRSCNQPDPTRFLIVVLHSDLAATTSPCNFRDRFFQAAPISPSPQEVNTGSPANPPPRCGTSFLPQPPSRPPNHLPDSVPFYRLTRPTFSRSATSPRPFA